MINIVELVYSMVLLALRSLALTSSRPFYVLLNGEPEQMERQEIAGFYVTRLVYATTATDAIERAVRQVNEELPMLAVTLEGRKVRLEVEECRELKSVVVRRPAGFSFYLEK